MTPVIDIAVDDDAWRVIENLESLVERAVIAAVATGQAAADRAIELSVVLSDDAFVQSLNSRWRGKDRPTNVLSFPAHAGPKSSLLGDIVVAFQTCAREAEDEGRGLDHHLSHLVVHGVFHLLGFDHEKDLEAETMEALEIRALNSLGIASPYAEATEVDLPT